MPVVDPVIVTIFPDDGQRVGTHRNHIGQARGGRVFHLLCEYICVRLGVHVLVATAARGARTGRAQQPKGIDTHMFVVPAERQFSFAFVGGHTCSFFRHGFLYFPSPSGEGLG